MSEDENDIKIDEVSNENEDKKSKKKKFLILLLLLLFLGSIATAIAVPVKIYYDQQIEARRIKVTLSESSVTLKAGETKSLTATVINTDNKTINWSSSNNSIAKVVNGVITGVSAGKVTIKATLATDSSITAECSVTVTAAPVPTITSPTVNNPTAKSLVYTGSAQELVDAGSTTGGTLQYKLGDGEYSTDIPTATNAGTYTVYFKVVGDTATNSVEEKSVSVTISKAKVTIPTGHSLTYDGVLKTGVNLPPDAKYTLTDNTATDVGDYTAIAVLIDKNNYEWDEINPTSDDEIINWSIGRATPTFSAPTAKVLTYNGSEQELINAGSVTGGSGTVQYKLNDGTYSTAIPTATDAGNYTVYYKVEGDSAYFGIDETSISVTIAKAQVAVPTANTGLVYNGTEQTGVTIPTDSKYSIIGNTGTNVGSYTATVSLNDINNYEWDLPTPTSDDQNINWSINSASLTVSENPMTSLVYTGSSLNLGSVTPSIDDCTISYKVGSGDYSSSLPQATDAGSYTVGYKVDKTGYSSVEGSFNVNIAKAKVSVPTANTGLVYDGTVQTGVTLPSDAKYSLTGNTSKEAGDHVAVASLTDTSNYEWDLTSPTTDDQDIDWSISVATSTLTVAPSAKTLSYTGSAQELITDGSTDVGQLEYKLAGGEYSTSIPTATNAGTYTVYYKVAGNSNYNGIDEASIDVTIAKAKVAVPTANTGLVYNGTEQTGVTLPTDAKYTLTENKATDAGSYSATANLTDSDNYVWDLATPSSSSQTITWYINSVTPTVTAPTAKTLTYNGSSQALVNAGSTTTGTTMKYKLGATGEYSTTIPTATNAGTYTVYYKVEGDGTNYEGVDEKSISVTIAKATPTVTAPTGKSLSYTGSALALVSAGSTTTGTTLQYRLSTSSTYSTTIPTASAAGSYTIYYKVVGNANYNDVAEKSVTATISKVAASVTTAPTAKTLDYTGSAQAIATAGSASGGTMYYMVSDTKPTTSSSGWSTSVPTKTDAGTYKLWYYVKGDANHTDTAVNSTALECKIVNVVSVTLTNTACSGRTITSTQLLSTESSVVSFQYAYSSASSSIAYKTCYAFNGFISYTSGALGDSNFSTFISQLNSQGIKPTSTSICPTGSSGSWSYLKFSNSSKWDTAGTINSIKNWNTASSSKTSYGTVTGIYGGYTAVSDSGDVMSDYMSYYNLSSHSVSINTYSTMKNNASYGFIICWMNS